MCYFLCYFLKNSQFGRSPEFWEQGTALVEGNVMKNGVLWPCLWSNYICFSLYWSWLCSTAGYLMGLILFWLVQGKNKKKTAWSYLHRKLNFFSSKNLFFFNFYDSYGYKKYPTDIFVEIPDMIFFFVFVVFFKRKWDKISFRLKFSK